MIGAVLERAHGIAEHAEVAKGQVQLPPLTEVAGQVAEVVLRTEVEPAAHLLPEGRGVDRGLVDVRGGLGRRRSCGHGGSLAMATADEDYLTASLVDPSQTGARRPSEATVTPAVRLMPSSREPRLRRCGGRSVRGGTRRARSTTSASSRARTLPWRSTSHDPRSSIAPAPHPRRGDPARWAPASAASHPPPRRGTATTPTPAPVRRRRRCRRLGDRARALRRWPKPHRSGGSTTRRRRRSR